MPNPRAERSNDAMSNLVARFPLVYEVNVTATLRGARPGAEHLAVSSVVAASMLESDGRCEMHHCECRERCVRVQDDF